LNEYTRGSSISLQGRPTEKEEMLANSYEDIDKTAQGYKKTSVRTSYFFIFRRKFNNFRRKLLNFRPKNNKFTSRI